MRLLSASLAAIALAAFAITGTAMARTVDLGGNFITENHATTTPSGAVKATLNTTTDMLKYTITYSGLSGPVQAAHFHGPAAMGVEAGVLVPIPGPYMSGMSGKAHVTKTVAKDLLAGMTYVNLHTAMEPMGEARAQIMAVK